MDKPALEVVIRDTVGKDVDFSFHIQDEDCVIILLEVDPERGAMLEDLRQAVERKVAALDGVSKVQAILTAEKTQDEVKRSKAVPDPHGMNKNPPVDVPAKQIIVVASGKGGVGKSTVSVNLAAGLVKRGMKVGLLDADIYGPSQPTLVGDTGYKPILNDQKKLVPLERYGMKVMSIGFIADTDKALVWRGPMVQTAFYQMLRDVDWGSAEDPLDYLIIDLPPGTGDVQLTLAQKVKATGAVIVSTPQDIALIDARRAVEMFEKTNVPILGLVENMSVHVCSACGHEDSIFGDGGAEAEAQKLDVPFLGALPLSRVVRECSDSGQPIILSDGHDDVVKAFNSFIDALVL